MSKPRLFIAGFIAGAIACLALFDVAANAQEAKCGPRADLVKMLGEKYHEVPVAIGMVNEQLLMETFASDAGTWTMFLTNTDGKSCLVSAGDSWQWDTTAFDDAKKGEAF